MNSPKIFVSEELEEFVSLKKQIIYVILFLQLILNSLGFHKHLSTSQFFSRQDDPYLNS